MQVLIDIPDEWRERQFNLYDVVGAVMNGTPLPKGHGRLIDADETLKKHCVELCKEKPSCHEDCLIYDLFHLAPTLIPADKNRK